MAKKANLDSGFLLLYDWLPALEELPAKEVKALLLALIARQRENTPLPIFKNKMTNSFARMIEPCIKRRLDGQTGGKKGQRPIVPPPPPLPQSKEEVSKENKSKAQKERSEALPADDAACPPPGSAPEAGDVVEKKNAVSGTTLTESERQELLKKGVSAPYIAAREMRATEHAARHKCTVLATLLRWWQQDTAGGGTTQEKSAAQGAAGTMASSFDADEFFTAALCSTYQNAADVPQI